MKMKWSGLPSRVNSYVLDYNRTNAYNRFLRENAKGKVVVDCGAGSGILSSLAYNYGAKKVISIERDPELFNNLKQFPWEARQSNLFKDDLPEADIYIHEIFGTNPYGEGFQYFLENCKRQGIEKKLFPNYIKFFHWEECPDWESEDPATGPIHFDPEIPEEFKHVPHDLSNFFHNIEERIYWEGSLLEEVDFSNIDYFVGWEISFDGKHSFSTLNKHYNSWFLYCTSNELLSTIQIETKDKTFIGIAPVQNNSLSYKEFNFFDQETKEYLQIPRSEILNIRAASK